MPDTAIVAPILIEWYQNNGRDLPWRKTRDPYLIWVSEIILQQTTVKQGLPYYQRFITRFPDIWSLARAEEDEVLKLWQGLGYYSRARNMMHTARALCDNNNGTFPQEYDALCKLKGIGPYTAAAISSFAFDRKHAVMDGNVIRFVSRYWGIEAPVDKRPAQAKIENLLSRMIPPTASAIFNQAIMEFGALYCKPQAPDCDHCPFNKSCLAFRGNIVSKLPAKSKNVKKRKRFFHFYHLEDKKGHIIIQKRKDKDIWKGLYQFPLIESTSSSVSHAGVNTPVDLDLIQSARPSGMYRQQLTHQMIEVYFYRIRCALHDIKCGSSEEFEIVSYDQLEKYPLPRIIDLYLSDKSITLV